MKRSVLFLVLILAWPAVSQAHFLWLLNDTQSGPGKVQVYFSESAEPDDPGLLDKVAKAEVWTLDGLGQPKALPLQKSADSLAAELPQPATTILRHTYGVSTKGGEPFLLKYYAKSYPFVLPGTWRAVLDHELYVAQGRGRIAGGNGIGDRPVVELLCRAHDQPDVLLGDRRIIARKQHQRLDVLAEPDDVGTSALDQRREPGRVDTLAGRLEPIGSKLHRVAQR